MLDELIPEWADRRATGAFDIGAALPTRDGRRIGNATVVRVSKSEHTGEPLFHVVTDKGNDPGPFSCEEMEELFWAPRWHQRDWPGKVKP